MRNEDKLSGAERFCHVAMTLVGLAVLLVMFGVLCYMVSDNMYVEIGLLAATLACILTGAWFANRKRRKESAAKSAAAMERLRESGVTKIREGEAHNPAYSFPAHAPMISNTPRNWKRKSVAGRYARPHNSPLLSLSIERCCIIELRRFAKLAPLPFRLASHV